ncbi:MAG: hypothetical protein ACYCZ0_01800 [Minisyncoccota bacterium]
MRVALNVTPDHVRQEAERRILARYPIWKQVNVLREGGEALAKMAAFVDGIRAASNQLEKMRRIPADYREDRHWL